MHVEVGAEAGHLEEGGLPEGEQAGDEEGELQSGGEPPGEDYG